MQKDPSSAAYEPIMQLVMKQRIVSVYSLCTESLYKDYPLDQCLKLIKSLLNLVIKLLSNDLAKLSIGRLGNLFVSFPAYIFTTPCHL